jgi:hypothetical protein
MTAAGTVVAAVLLESKPAVAVHLGRETFDLKEA